MRLIDAEALKISIPEAEPDAFENCRTCGTLTRYDVENLIDDAPTVDAVLVVRCENCKHAETDRIGCYCILHDDRVAENDFCSHGERRQAK